MNLIMLENVIYTLFHHVGVLMNVLLFLFFLLLFLTKTQQNYQRSLLSLPSCAVISHHDVSQCMMMGAVHVVLRRPNNSQKTSAGEL